MKICFKNKNENINILRVCEQGVCNTPLRKTKSTNNQINNKKLWTYN